MTAKKILMIVGDYVEDYEAMMPFQALPMVSHIDKGTAGVVVDSNMVTGATFLSLSEWLTEFLKLLDTKISLLSAGYPSSRGGVLSDKGFQLMERKGVLFANS